MKQRYGKRKGDGPKERGLNRNCTLIRAEHRGKLAVVYIRQATPDAPSESTESQLALANLPRRWGWPASAIAIVEDLGDPGLSSTQRSGFQRLLEMMGRDEVGIVLVRDVTRLSRNPSEMELFVEKATRHRVLLGVNWNVYKLSAKGASALFMLSLSELRAQHAPLRHVRTFPLSRRTGRRSGGIR